MDNNHHKIRPMWAFCQDSMLLSHGYTNEWPNSNSCVPKIIIASWLIILTKIIVFNVGVKEASVGLPMKGNMSKHVNIIPLACCLVPKLYIDTDNEHHCKYNIVP